MFGGPPSTAAVNVASPSPSNVLFSPGSLIKSFPIIVLSAV